MLKTIFYPSKITFISLLHCEISFTYLAPVNGVFKLNQVSDFVAFRRNFIPSFRSCVISVKALNMKED